MVYYSNVNTREYHEADEQSLEVGSDFAPAVEHLITNYPRWVWVRVEDLPLDKIRRSHEGCGRSLGKRSADD